MNDDLLALADLDDALGRARHDEAHLASQAVADRATAELAELAAAKRDLDGRLAPLVARVASLERDATAARDRAAVIAARLAESTGAGRDLAAMEVERGHLDERASQLEDDQLEVLEELEPLEADDAALRARASAAVARRDEATASLATERADAARALQSLAAARPSLAAAVDPALLTRYEAVAKKTGTSGAARLVEGRCGGCRVAVPAAVADRMLHGADTDGVEVCDECGRLLVR